MSARICTAEASVITGGAEQHGEMRATRSTCFEALVPPPDWSDMGVSDHCMLVYDEDVHLLDVVSRFTGVGLAAGDAAVVIATQLHLEHLEARLRASGADLAAARAQGQYVPVDAAETLAQCMIDGWPDERCFVDVVGGVIARASSRYPRVRACGDLVALLWMEGYRNAVLRLEDLWHDLITLHAFPLLCAYPMRGFAKAVHTQKLLTIGAAHSRVIAAEGSTALASADECRRTIVPQPHALAGERVERQTLAQSLHRNEQDLAEETREFLAAIVDSSDDAIIGQTLEGVITSWNRGAERLYGYTAAEVLGKPLSLLVPPDLPNDLPQILMRLQRGEGIHHYETRRLHRDGTRRDVSLTISPMRDSAGRIVGASKIARDISERKRVEAALQQACTELEQRVMDRTVLLALMHDITVAANAAPGPAAALQVAVDRICAYTGWPVGHAYLSDTAGHWVPTPVWHLADPTRFAAFQQATQTLQIAPGEGLIGRVGTTGIPAWGVEVTTDPAFLRQHIAAQNGLTTGFASPLLVGQEVVGVLEFYGTEKLAPEPALLDALRQIGIELGRTIERQRARERMQRQQEALFQREKLAAMGSLLASVAHELNNPLAIVLLQADLLREEAGQGPLAELTAELTQAATRCERLIRQFLTLARQHTPERSAVALNLLVTDTVNLLTPSFQVDNITVSLHLADDLPLLWADPHHLQQVVVNLLTNGQQALRDVAAPRQLTIITQGDAAHTRVTLAVADTGPGIPVALQARIFEPFFTTRPQGVGTGLGLSLCRGIIEEHGGTLRMTSYPGQGATFHVELPVDAVPATMPMRPGAADGPAVRSCAILLVEDEPGIANGLARLLRRDGHTVDMAANGRLALARLQERTYDLLLSDVRMPELDGPGLYRILAQQQSHLCQRIIFLTGDTLAPETKSFLEQSSVRCLEKPFAIATVRRVLQQVLQQAL